MRSQKHIILSLLFAIISLTAFSQSYFKSLGERTYDLYPNEQVKEILKTEDGFMIVGECINQSDGFNQVLLVKTDMDGEVLWKNSYGSKSNHSYEDIRKLADGSFILLLEKEETAGPAIAVKTISSSGGIKSEFNFAPNDKNVAREIIQLPGGGIVIAGYRSIKGDNDSDGWIIKVNKKGREEWMRLFGERYIDDKILTITSDNSEGIYIAGYTCKKIGEKPIPVIYSLDQRGNAIWELEMEEFKNGQIESLTFDPDMGLIALILQKDNTGNGIASTRAFISKTGELAGSNTVPFGLQLGRNKFYTHPDGSILALGLSQAAESGEIPDFAMKLNQNFESVWKKGLEEGVQMAAVSGIGKNQYMIAGNYSEMQQSDIIVQQFNDLSGILIDSYINTKLIAAGEKDGSERMDGFKERVGNRKYRQLYDQYFVEARTSLNMMGDKRMASSQMGGNTKPVQAVKNNTTGTVLDGKYYALLIAVNDYDDPEITDLDQPSSDAQKLYDVLLDDYTFEEVNMTMLKNPTREKIIGELDRLTRVVKEEDNLLVFYAGHGYWDETTKNGYWLPSNASKQNTANWIRNSAVSDYIRSIPSRHTLLIADACFSGSIFKTRSAFSESKPLQRLHDLPSRKAMTSGTLKEVPDKSVFLQFMIKRLKDNGEDFLPSEQLFFSFKPAVLNNSDNIPQYGVVNSAGDEGGDFIFIHK